MKRILISIMIIGALILSAQGAALAAAITILHEFEGYPGDGAYASASMVLSGSTLYGVTSGGGASDVGTLFKVNTDGTGYLVLHEFTGTGEVGSPYAALTLSGNTIYGTSAGGGATNEGTVYKYDISSGNVTLVHEFVPSEANNFCGGVTLVDGTLYGMGMFGGANSAGSIYKVNANGSDFSVMYDFAGGFGSGVNPYGEILYNPSDNKLYGGTPWGGISGAGNIFTINTNGTGYENIYEFAGADGSEPFGDLVLGPDDMLYGTTGSGGDYGYGTVFRMSTDGSGMEVLHSFNNADGYYPYIGGLAFAPDGRLVGTTYYGGEFGAGVIFSLDQDGTDFALLHEFSSPGPAGPQATRLILTSNNKIYGVTRDGGASGIGTVYSMDYPTPEPATVVSGLIGLLGLAGRRLMRRKKLVNPDKSEILALYAKK